MAPGDAGGHRSITRNEGLFDESGLAYRRDRPEERTAEDHGGEVQVGKGGTGLNAAKAER
jgi:hypothetical protein